MKIDKILIVADDSPASIKAIQYGFSLAADIGAKVMLLSVIEAALTIGNPDAGIFPDDALISLKAKTEDFLNGMKRSYAKNVSAEICLPVGDDVQTTIIETAVKWQADLIVTGTHSRTGLSKLLSGSISESIIHHSPIPVFVVPIG
jgi:nucleotide-binding universal stress UspA family protein